MTRSFASDDYRTNERANAVQRGLEFIYRHAQSQQTFSEHGSDLLSCFFLIASTTEHKRTRREARTMGATLARRWRDEKPALPADADADEIAEFVQGTDAADRLGVPDKALKAPIAVAAGKFSPADYLWFDPFVEPPPSDVPQQCDCGRWNDRGRRRCAQCRRALFMASRYWVWYYALTTASIGDCYGVTLGAHLSDVISWIPKMRPYRGRDGDENPDYYAVVYAITHVIYTLNDYNHYRLQPRRLPHEFRFLKENLREAIALQDAEMLGEFLDTLKAFGLSNHHPIIKYGIDYLLAHQNSDGSWGDIKEEDAYTRYHETWTAIDGLRDYAWRGNAPNVLRLKPLNETHL
jgi:hypothetical protein